MLTSGSDEVLCPFSFICILCPTKRIYLMCVNNNRLLLLYILVSQGMMDPAVHTSSIVIILFT